MIRTKSELFAYLVEQASPGQHKSIANDEKQCRCILPANHKQGDKRPSFRYNAEKLGFICDACGIGGNLDDLYGLLHMPGYTTKVDRHAAWKEMREKWPDVWPEKRDTKAKVDKAKAKAKADPDEKPRGELPSKHRLRKWHEQLLTDTGQVFQGRTPLTNAIEARCWSVEVMEKYLIGWDQGRYMIPIFDGKNVANVRKYLPGAKNKIFGVSGCNANRWFPGLPSAEAKGPVWIVEGEPDCLAARSLGLNAYTLTGGAKNMTNELVVPLIGHEINIMYDNDQAGRDGAEMLSDAILKMDFSMASTVRLVHYNEKECVEGDDLTDIALRGVTRDTLKEWAEYGTIKAKKKGSNDAVYSCDFQRATDKAQLGKTIKIEVQVSGKGPAPYYAPKRMVLACKYLGSMDKCLSCPISQAANRLEWNLTLEEMNEYIGESKAMTKKSAERLKGILCPKFIIVEEDLQDIDSVIVNRIIVGARRVDEMDSTSQSRQVFFFRSIDDQSCEVEPNATYRVTGKNMPRARDGMSQEVYFGVEPIENDIDATEVTDEDKTIIDLVGVEIEAEKSQETPF